MYCPMQRSVGLLCCACLAVDAFYLPGVAPHEYADGERVEIKVNKLSSTKTQVRASLQRFHGPVCTRRAMPWVAAATASNAALAELTCLAPLS